jgi:hypothetical protein
VEITFEPMDDQVAPSRSWTAGLLGFVRGKVSGDKNRFIDEQFDLDLSYITDRIIGKSDYLAS